MKKTVITKFLSAICLVGIMLSLFACENTPNETESNTNAYHTVSFNSKGGSAVPSVKVEAGKALTRPSDPSLDNHVFCRWEYNGSPWVFTESIVKQDMTLNAVWISAEKLFGIEPTENGDLSITSIRRQESLDWLNVPTMINGKKVVAISDNAFENAHEAHTLHLIFPESVTFLGNYAFKSISKTKITLNGVISKLGEGTFERCSTLSEIKLGEGMETLPFRAFSECVALERIEIPNGVKKIDEDAFSGCSALRSIVLPATLTSVENAAFDDCTSLQTVFFKGTEEQLDKLTVAKLNDAFIDAKVYVYSEQQPTESGSFWRYDKNNSPVVW